MSRRDRIQKKNQSKFGFATAEPKSFEDIDPDLLHEIMRGIVQESVKHIFKKVLVHGAQQGWHRLTPEEAKLEIENYLRSLN